MSESGASWRDRALVLAGISKRFGGQLAVDGASLELRRGTVHAVLGENGAGKTTLMRVAFGLVAPDAGTIAVNGTVRRIASPADAIASGLGMVHQHFTNVGAMTVAENVVLGGRGRLDLRAAAMLVDDIATRTGLSLNPHDRAEQLSVGAQQRLEIVKALARDARILILDEPTAVLAPAESEQLLHWIRSFAAAGNSVVLITHKLREALTVADDVTVLRHGRVVARVAAAQATTDSLADAILGEPGEPVPPKRASAPGTAVATAADVTIIDGQGRVAIRGATFELYAGTITGIAAVEGSGQRELLRVLAQRAAASEGHLVVPANTGFVPEDRHRDALILEFGADENVLLRGAALLRGRIDWRAVRAQAAALMTEYEVRGARNERAPVRMMSGGNQQKLVLARELTGDPALLVVENPTRGLDIRATQAVHERLRAAAANGAAVVMYSSDLDEVLAVADRVLVVHAGRVAECARDRDAVGAAMLGVA